MSKHLRLVVQTIMLATALVGCGGDDDDPVPVPPPGGTVVVNAEPDSIAAPWQLVGPGGVVRAAAGDTTLADLTPGDYTLSWGAVGGWIAPTGGTQTLAEDAVATFAGTYEEFSVSPDLFVYVAPGTFTMGSPANEVGRVDDEVAHAVTLTHAFYIFAGEVTNQQYTDLAQWAYDNGYITATSSILSDHLDGSGVYLKMLGSLQDVTFSDGTFTCTRPDHPVKFVTWYGAAAYCDWLSLQQGLPRAYNHGTWLCNGGDPYAAAGYRLPTEAEWEYACRAGATTALVTGPLIEVGCTPLDANLDQAGWYCGNAGTWTHPSREKDANAWGLYDVHGNVWEWCNDWYGPYAEEAATDPAGAVPGTDRVLRGGSWTYTADQCRSACRGTSAPNRWFDDFGFRVVKTAD